MMVKTCLNPHCDRRFTRFGDGEIYSLEKRLPGVTEFFWLCGSCLPHFALVVTNLGTIDIVERRNGMHLPPPNAKMDLRVVFPAHSPCAAAQSELALC